MWTPLVTDLEVPLKSRLLCKCKCGKEQEVIVASILAGETYGCKSCAMRRRSAALSAERRVEIATAASKKAAEVKALEIDPYGEKYGYEALELVLTAVVGARQRCLNPNNAAYPNYGGRGITFDFPSVRSAAEWVLDNLGTKPETNYSLDRIDNNKGYTPGNLRWASRTEQNSNKREYKRTKKGERIRAIMLLRKDLTYETIRSWIAQGSTDQEILNRRKGAHASPCV